MVSYGDKKTINNNVEQLFKGRECELKFKVEDNLSEIEAL